MSSRLAKLLSAIVAHKVEWLMIAMLLAISSQGDLLQGAG